MSLILSLTWAFTFDFVQETRKSYMKRNFLVYSPHGYVIIARSGVDMPQYGYMH